MKAIALAIFLVGLFYTDMEMTKKFGHDYDGSGPMLAITLFALFAFAALLIVEKNT